MFLDDQISSINSDEHILIDFQPLNMQCMITNWKKGVLFYKWTDKQWIVEDIDPGFVLISDEYSENNCAAAYHFMQQFPDDLKTSVKLFSQNQFTLLKLFSIYPSLLDIFKHSPNLVWMVVIWAIKKQWSLDKIFQLLQKKREQIITQFIMSDSKGIVSFINKVQLLHGDQYEYRLIRECSMNANIIKFFSHWETIPVHALVLLRKYPNLIKTNLLQDSIDLKLSLYQQQSLLFPVCSIIEDIKRMAELMSIKLSNRYFRNLNTIYQVNRSHDRLTDQVNDFSLSVNSSTIFFPICPLGDTNSIIQIKNNIELGSEGRSMHNCVAGYENFLLEGTSFIYKVINPERGTLHISCKNNKYDISQFRLLCNGKPSQNSFKTIRQWLNRGTKQLK